MRILELQAWPSVINDQQGRTIDLQTILSSSYGQVAEHMHMRELLVQTPIQGNACTAPGQFGESAKVNLRVSALQADESPVK
jgi:hypothetical protein